jgi:MFS family permease
MTAPSPRPPALGFIFVTLVLLVLSFGIIIPVLPRLVTQFEGGSVAEGSNAYGSLIGVFALMQFLASPILGALSDRFGRRKVLLLALAGSTIDNLVMGLAPSLGWLSAIFGPPLAALSFGVCIAPDTRLHLPGIAFFEAATLLLLALRAFPTDAAAGRTA